MLAICDRCGFERQLNALRKEWTGLMVCSECWDPRHPQLNVRAVRDTQGIRPDMRPEPADVFVVEYATDEDGYVIFDEVTGLPLTLE